MSGTRKRKVLIATTSRSDWGPLSPVARRLRDDPRFDLAIAATGSHLDPARGMTVSEIEASGFEVRARVPSIGRTDSPAAIAASIGSIATGFAEVFEREGPDLLLVLGDRIELLGIVAAALPFAIPIAHVHGGESTEGAIDDQVRHAVTKLSHLHFASTKEYAQRIVQMGEDPARVFVSGAPGLDNIASVAKLSRRELAQRLGFSLDGPFLIVTYHPETLDRAPVEERVRALLDALESTTHALVLTYPGADAGSRAIVTALEKFEADHTARAKLVASLGTEVYLSLLGEAAAMVGNSSSGIIEAASFELPVVNIGDRQKGRVRARNVIDCGRSAVEIRAAIERATSPRFRASLEGLENPYGDGRAAEKIAERLASADLESGRLARKTFHDLGGVDSSKRERT